MSPGKADHEAEEALASSFYQRHELEFARAAGQLDINDRRFDYTGSAFDDWAVAIGEMRVPVRDGADRIERTGLADLRTSIRRRLNRAARAGHGVPRRFSVEARGGKWRVVLIEGFIQDQPLELLKACQQHHDNCQDQITRVAALIDTADFTAEERRGNLYRIAVARDSFLLGIQNLEMAVRSMEPGAGKPNMKRLRRKMSAAIVSEYAVSPAKPPAKSPRRRKA